MCLRLGSLRTEPEMRILFSDLLRGYPLRRRGVREAVQVKKESYARKLFSLETSFHLVPWGSPETEVHCRVVINVRQVGGSGLLYPRSFSHWPLAVPKEG